MASKNVTVPGLESDHKKASLLDLPPEISSAIVKFAVEEATPIPLNRFSKSTKLSLSGGFPTKQPPITRVCRTIREECLTHYYKANAFYAYRRCETVIHLERWLRAIGEKNRESLGPVSFIEQHALRSKASWVWDQSISVSLVDGKARLRKLEVEEYVKFVQEMQKIWQFPPVGGVSLVEVEKGIARLTSTMRRCRLP